MLDINNWEWTIDKEKMCCRSIKNKVTVKITAENDTIKGKIDDMPVELFGKIAEFEDGENIIRQIVENAEAAFKKG